MSGIYIPGMEMPKNCCGCVFSWYTPTGKTPFCKRTGKDLTADVYFNKRSSDCPLIPVPDHGQLGDLGELYKLMESYSDYSGAREPHDDNEIHRDSILFAIECATTIIPADKEEQT